MKGSSSAKTITEYISLLPEDRRSDIKALHILIRKTLPDLKPHIANGMMGYGTYHYRYASGREGDWPVVSLASQKNYISLYVCFCDDGRYVADFYAKDLPRANIGKSCIRFKKLEDIDLNVIRKLLKHTYRVYKKDYS